MFSSRAGLVSFLVRVIRTTPPVPKARLASTTSYPDTFLEKAEARHNQVTAAFARLDVEVLSPLAGQGMPTSRDHTAALITRFRSLILDYQSRPSARTVSALQVFMTYGQPNQRCDFSVPPSPDLCRLHSLLERAHAFSQTQLPIRGVASWLQIMDQFVRSNEHALSLLAAPRVAERLGNGDYTSLSQLLGHFSDARSLSLETTSIRRLTDLRVLVDWVQNRLPQQMPELKILYLSEKTVEDLARFFPNGIGIQADIRSLPSYCAQTRSPPTLQIVEPPIPREWLLPA